MNKLQFNAIKGFKFTNIFENKFTLDDGKISLKTIIGQDKLCIRIKGTSKVYSLIHSAFPVVIYENEIDNYLIQNKEPLYLFYLSIKFKQCMFCHFICSEKKLKCVCDSYTVFVDYQDDKLNVDSMERDDHD